MSWHVERVDGDQPDAPVLVAADYEFLTEDEARRLALAITAVAARQARYIAQGDATWRLDPIDDELPEEERPPVGSRWWHRWGKWMTIIKTPNERGWPVDEVMAIDDDGQRYGVKVKSLSEAP